MLLEPENFNQKKMQMLGTYEPQDQRPGGQPNILPHLPKSSSPQMYKQRIGYNQGDQSAEDFMSPKIRRLLSRRPTAPLDFCPKSRLHALALGHLTSSEKTIRRHHNQLICIIHTSLPSIHILRNVAPCIPPKGLPLIMNISAQIIKSNLQLLKVYMTHSQMLGKIEYTLPAKF